jgi:hypothetical protein
MRLTIAVRKSRYGIRFPNVWRYQPHGSQRTDRTTGHKDRLLRVVDSSGYTSSDVYSFPQNGDRSLLDILMQSLRRPLLPWRFGALS